LNDVKLPRGLAAANLKNAIKTLYSSGGRRFVVALLPTMIPSFSAVGEKLNPDLSSIPNSLRDELPGSQIVLSRWGSFFDEVMGHPARYGISNTRNRCAGRSIFHEDPTPCLHPDRYFYYHEGHPSTAVQKAVGEMLYKEYLQRSAQRPYPSVTHIPVVPSKSGVSRP
jgi:cholinesterase